MSSRPPQGEINFDFKTENIDPEFLIQLRSKEKLQRQVLTASVVLLMIALVALQLFK